MENQKSLHFGKCCLTGTLTSLAASIVLVLALAFCLRFFGISNLLLEISTFIIKCLAILLGTIWAIKKSSGAHISFSQTLLLGLMIGACFSIGSFLLFSCLNGFTFDFSLSLITNLIFSALIGALSAVIAKLIVR